MEEHLEQVCYKENISVEEVIYFLFTSLEAKGSTENIFYCIVLVFKAEKFLLQLHLTKYVKRYDFSKIR